MTALADTLFPSDSVAEGLAAALAPVEHFLTRLRVLHPLLAVMTVSAAALATRLMRGRVLARVRAFMVLSLGQMGLGALTIALGSPLWVRLPHLGVADAICVSYVWLAAQTLSSSASQRIDRIDRGQARKACAQIGQRFSLFATPLQKRHGSVAGCDRSSEHHVGPISRPKRRGHLLGRLAYYGQLVSPRSRLVRTARLCPAEDGYLSMRNPTERR